jgi:ATP-dependent Clp protease ATP-binding subunit ClpA
MFERFEPSARWALSDARDEARRTGRDRIGSEHVLLGLLAQPGTAADALTDAGLTLPQLRSRVPARSGGSLDADALASLGIDLDAVRRATDAAFGPGALDQARRPSRRQLPMAEDTKRTLVGAVRYAHQHGGREVSSGHLLIGILDQPDIPACALLAETGTDLGALRADVQRRIDVQAEHGAA